MKINWYYFKFKLREKSTKDNKRYTEYAKYKKQCKCVLTLNQ